MAMNMIVNILFSRQKYKIIVWISLLIGVCL